MLFLKGQPQESETSRCEFLDLLKEMWKFWFAYGFKETLLGTIFNNTGVKLGYFVYILIQFLHPFHR